MAGNWPAVEPLARAALETWPEDLILLSNLDMALNGQGRFDEADAVREQIVALWQRDHRADWIARGSPAQDAAWVRLLVFTEHYMVAATQYYEPVVLEGPGTLTYHYKFIVFGQAEGYSDALFKLESSFLHETNYFLGQQLDDGSHRQLGGYGTVLPDIRDVTFNVVEYLEGPVVAEPEVPTAPTEVPDVEPGNPDVQIMIDGAPAWPPTGPGCEAFVACCDAMSANSTVSLSCQMAAAQYECAEALVTVQQIMVELGVPADSACE